MKRTFVLAAVAVIAAAVAAAWLLRQPAASTAAPAQEPAPVASIGTVMPVRATAPLTVAAYGDIAPDQVQTVGFARPGQLAALNVVAGQRVAKGAVLARLSSDPLADAALAQARSALTLAEGESKRTQAMLALQLATTSQVEAARRTEADARSALQAQEKLGAGGGMAEATAPFDGVVIVLNAAQGDRLAAGAPVLQLGRVDALRATLGVDPADVSQVHVGAKATLTPASAVVPNGGASAPSAVDARVKSLQGVLDARTQLVSVVVALPPGATSTLLPGMHVSAVIQTGSRDGWTLPRQAVLSDDKGSYVYEKRSDVAHRVAVVPLAQGDGSVTVDGPLSTGTPVVSVGNYELVDGMKIVEKTP